MENKNIAFYIPALYKGGSERVLISLAERFKEAGYIASIVTDYQLENEYTVPNGIERTVLVDTSAEKLSGFKAIRRFRRFCKKNRIGTVVSFLNIYHAVIATLFLKTKCVVSVRNDPTMTYRSLSSRIKNRLLLPLTDGIVFQTRDAQDHFPYCRNKKSAIIANPIKEEFFSYCYKGLSGRIVTVGRLTRQKNQRILIDAFSEIVKNHNDLTLEIYGDGELREELSDHINKLGLSESIFLRGQTADVAKVLSESTVFVLPSLFEGMPNALMEAMAVGLPCVATDCRCGGSGMLLSDECGILINNDKLALEKALTSLLDDGALREKYSQNARKKAKSFKGENIFSEWKNFIDKL